MGHASRPLVFHRTVYTNIRAFVVADQLAGVCAASELSFAPLVTVPKTLSPYCRFESRAVRSFELFLITSLEVLRP